MPRIACRVVCGLAEAMAILVPTNAFVSVDFPVLGRPTRHAKPDRYEAPSVLVEDRPSSSEGHDSSLTFNQAADRAGGVDGPDNDTVARQVPDQRKIILGGVAFAGEGDRFQSRRTRRDRHGDCHGYGVKP